MEWNAWTGLMKSLKVFIVFVGGFLAVVYAQQPQIVVSMLEGFVAPATATVIMVLIGLFINYVKNTGNLFTMPRLFE